MKTSHHRLLLCVIVLISACCPIFLLAAGTESGKIPITTTSEKAKTYFLQGRDLAEKLRGQDSLQYFQKAIDEDPNFALAYLNRGFAQPNFSDFSADLNKAVALSDKASDGERNQILATQAATAGTPTKQGEYLQKLVAAYPNDERAHNLLATYEFGLQKYDAAVEHFQKATSINPNFSPAYNLLGYSYRFLEQFDKSEAAFKKYIQLIPNDPNPYDSYAELLMKIGKYDESIVNYQKALSLDPHFVNSYVGIATNLDFKGDHEGARKELQKLYDSARNDGERRIAVQTNAISYLYEGKPESAIAEQQKCVALDETMKDPAGKNGDLNTIATILIDAGKGEEAKKRIDEAWQAMAASNLSDGVKRVADWTRLLLNGNASLKTGDLKTAEANAAELTKQAALNKNQFLSWSAHQLSGSIAMEKKSYDQAIAEFAQSNLQDPHNMYRLAMAYQGKGDQAKAAEQLKKVNNFNGLASIQYAFVRAKAKQAQPKS